jgi:FixJ family two-component response regulator
VVNGVFYSNKQVAIQLDISVKTIENHRAKVMLKMNTSNAAELVRMAMLAL